MKKAAGRIFARRLLETPRPRDLPRHLRPGGKLLVSDPNSARTAVA
ncbi:hypothetical protein [Amycolatopsis plumensis]